MKSFKNLLQTNILLKRIIYSGKNKKYLKIYQSESNTITTHIQLQTCEAGRRSACQAAVEAHRESRGSCVLLGRVPACRATPGSGGPARLAPDHPSCPGPLVQATEYYWNGSESTCQSPCDIKHNIKLCWYLDLKWTKRLWKILVGYMKVPHLTCL